MVLLNEHEPDYFPEKSQIAAALGIGHGEKLLKFSTEMTAVDVSGVILRYIMRIGRLSLTN